MRPIYGCPEKFRRVLTSKRFPKFVMGFCSDRHQECAYKIGSSKLYPSLKKIGATEKISAVHGYDHAPFSPKFFRGFCSHACYEYTCQNLKFVPLPVPEIIWGAQKIWAVPGYAHAPFSPIFKRAFVRTDPVNKRAKFEVRSFIRS